MMKKLLIYVMLALIGSSSMGQSNYFSFSDLIIGQGNNLKSAIDYTPYIPNSATPMKYIRVNFHFMQRSDGTGNFGETSDGVTTNSIYTGYYFAKKVIEIANARLIQNPKSNLPPNNSTPILDPRYSFILDGVYFHPDNSNYIFGSSNAVSLYSVNNNNVINVFFEGKNNSIGASAWADMVSPCFIEFNGKWDNYQQFALNPPYPGVIDDFMWTSGGGLLHESGHNMGLYHTLMDSQGNCDLNAEDYCADTPTGQEMITTYGAPQMCKIEGGISKVLCGWNQTGPFCSNNMMDYSGITSITPDQLGIAHYAFANYMSGYQLCKTLQNNLDVITFPDNKILFSGNNITIPLNVGTSMIIKNGQSKTIIFSNSLILNGGFEVKPGGALEVSMQNYCP